MPGAFTANLAFVAQGQMNDAALPAVHGIELEGNARAFHFFSGSNRAQPQFLNAKRAIILRVKGDARVVLGRHAQRFHGDVFERQ